MRIGSGYDVHAFGPGDHVVLGGVRIPHPAGLVAHSDGDAVLHALADAMLGAIAAGDIGQHFPDTDPVWRDADSRALLRQVAALVAAADLPVALAALRGFGFVGVNVTIPHKEAVLPLLDAIDPAAQRIGAVNTIVNRSGVLTGYNTDVRHRGLVFHVQRVHIVFFGILIQLVLVIAAIGGEHVREDGDGAVGLNAFEGGAGGLDFGESDCAHVILLFACGGLGQQCSD